MPVRNTSNLRIETTFDTNNKVLPKQSSTAHLEEVPWVESPTLKKDHHQQVKIDTPLIQQHRRPSSANNPSSSNTAGEALKKDMRRNSALILSPTIQNHANSTHLPRKTTITTTTTTSQNENTFIKKKYGDDEDNDDEVHYHHNNAKNKPPPTLPPMTSSKFDIHPPVTSSLIVKTAPRHHHHDYNHSSQPASFRLLSQNQPRTLSSASLGNTVNSITSSSQHGRVGEGSQPNLLALATQYTSLRLPNSMHHNNNNNNNSNNQVGSGHHHHKHNNSEHNSTSGPHHDNSSGHYSSPTRTAKPSTASPTMSQRVASSSSMLRMVAQVNNDVAIDMYLKDVSNILQEQQKEKTSTTSVDNNDDNNNNNNNNNNNSSSSSASALVQKAVSEIMGKDIFSTTTQQAQEKQTDSELISIKKTDLEALLSSMVTAHLNSLTAVATQISSSSSSFASSSNTSKGRQPQQRDNPQHHVSNSNNNTSPINNHSHQRGETLHNNNNNNNNTHDSAFGSQHASFSRKNSSYSRAGTEQESMNNTFNNFSDENVLRTPNNIPASSLVQIYFTHGASRFQQQQQEGTQNDENSITSSLLVSTTTTTNVQQQQQQNPDNSLGTPPLMHSAKSSMSTHPLSPQNNDNDNNASDNTVISTMSKNKNPSLQSNGTSICQSPAFPPSLVPAASFFSRASSIRHTKKAVRVKSNSNYISHQNGNNNINNGDEHDELHNDYSDDDDDDDNDDFGGNNGGNPSLVQVNQYQILYLIGKGCQGSVFLAIDLECNEVRALKQIPKPVTTRSLRSRVEQSRHRRRLMQEISIMKKCRHPNLVRLYEVIDDDKARHVYLALRFVEHGQLVHVDEETGEASRSFTVAQVIRYAAQLSSALQYLHDRRIVHCDLNYNNVLLGNDDTVYLADFGVSRLFPSKKIENGEHGSADQQQRPRKNSRDSVINSPHSTLINSAGTVQNQSMATNYASMRMTTTGVGGKQYGTILFRPPESFAPPPSTSPSCHHSQSSQSQSQNPSLISENSGGRNNNNNHDFSSISPKLLPQSHMAPLDGENHSNRSSANPILINNNQSNGQQHQQQHTTSNSTPLISSHQQNNNNSHQNSLLINSSGGLEESGVLFGREGSVDHQQQHPSHLASPGISSRSAPQINPFVKSSTTTNLGSISAPRRSSLEEEKQRKRRRSSGSANNNNDEDRELEQLKAGDVYALGLTVFVLLFGRLPFGNGKMKLNEFPNITSLLDHVADQTEEFDIPKFCAVDDGATPVPLGVVAALKSMLAKNPKKRCTAAEANSNWLELHEALEEQEEEEERRRLNMSQTQALPTDLNIDDEDEEENISGGEVDEVPNESARSDSVSNPFFFTTTHDSNNNVSRQTLGQQHDLNTSSAYSEGDDYHKHAMLRHNTQQQRRETAVFSDEKSVPRNEKAMITLCDDGNLSNGDNGHNNDDNNQNHQMMSMSGNNSGSAATMSGSAIKNRDNSFLLVGGDASTTTLSPSSHFGSRLTRVPSQVNSDSNHSNNILHHQTNGSGTNIDTNINTSNNDEHHLVVPRESGNLLLLPLTPASSSSAGACSSSSITQQFIVGQEGNSSIRNQANNSNSQDSSSTSPTNNSTNTNQNAVMINHAYSLGSSGIETNINNHNALFSAAGVDRNCSSQCSTNHLMSNKSSSSSVGTDDDDEMTPSGRLKNFLETRRRSVSHGDGSLTSGENGNSGRK